MRQLGGHTYRDESAAAGRPEGPGTFLFVVPWSLQYPGGVNQVIINLYRECERSGVMRPLVLVLDWSHGSAVEQTELGCRTVHLRVRAPCVGGRVRVRGMISYLLRLPATIRDLRKLIERYNIRVINAHYPTLEALNFAILKTLGLFNGKLLLSFHGLDIRNAAQQRGVERILWRWLLRRGDALIACSDSLGRDIRTYDPNAALALVTVRNGVDTDVLLHERQSMQAPPRKISARPYVLNVATFEHKKGQDILIKAFTRIAADFPDIDLVIIGGDGPTRQQVASLIDQAGLASRALCLLNLPHADVLAYIEGATVFVLPSRAEGLPIAILEAASFAIPVVASRVDGIPEVINSEQVGILFEPEDDRGLETALRYLLVNRELSATIGKNLQTRVASEFTWEKAWADYSDLLKVGAPLSQQSAYNRAGEGQVADIDRSIYETMRLYCVNDLGLSGAIASKRADEELQRRIPRAVITDLSSAGIDVADRDVFDLGAGLGGMSEELVTRGARVTALEPGAAWAAITKRRVQRHSGSFLLLEAVGESIPLPPASADLVVSLQVLEHVKDPSKVLAEIWRVLRPGGLFYLACENYLTFYEPHYRLPWLPLLPKSLGALYLRLIGRSPRFLNEAITYVTYPGVLRACRRLGFIRRRDEEMISNLRSRKGSKWAVLRAMTRLTGERGPLWLNQARYAFRVGIYEIFRKPV